MRNLLRSILGILVVIVCIKVFALFVFLCYIGFFVPESPNPLESIEDKIEQVEKKERVLTENEKELPSFRILRSLDTVKKVYGSHDLKEGASSFVKKTDPKWQDK